MKVKGNICLILSCLGSILFSFYFCLRSVYPLNGVRYSFFKTCG
jgi:hypothetical protein